MKLKIIAAAALAASAAFAAPQWTTGSYVQSSWTANPSNVFWTATAAGHAEFVNGSLPVGYNDDSSGVVKNNTSAEIVLSKTAQIDELRFWSHWKDSGRDGICVTSVEVKTSASDEWTDIGAPSVSYGVKGDSSGVTGTGTLFAFLANEDGTPLASAVTAVRVNFGVQDNDWTCYGEIEAVGAFDDGKWLLSVADPGEDLGSVVCSPASEDGWYAAGTSVTVTFTPASDDITFLYWDGSASDDQKTSAEVVLTMDGHRSLEAKCQTQEWVFYSDKNLLTDGLQSFGAKGTLDSIVITSGKDYGGKKELDLRRPVRGGGKITGIDTDGLALSGYRLDTLYLPDTLKSVRRGLGELGLKKIEPFLPDSVTSVGGASLFNAGSSLYGQELRLGYAKDEDGNPVQTVFEIWNDSEGSIAFKDASVGPSVDLGPGITDIPHYTFYTATGIETLQLRGDLTRIAKYAFQNIATTKATTVTFHGDLPAEVSEVAFGTPKDYLLRFCVTAEGHSRWTKLLRDSAKVAPWRSLDESVKAKYWANWPEADGNKRPFGLTTSEATLDGATLPANCWVLSDLKTGAILIVR